MMVTTEVSGRHAVPVDEPAEPEVTARATRRVFSAQYKLRILAEYERRDRHGRSALLRREGLYTSSISEWQNSTETQKQKSIFPIENGSHSVELHGTCL